MTGKASESVRVAVINTMTEKLTVILRVTITETEKISKAVRVTVIMKK